MNENEIIKFDSPLIGIPNIKNGYRITFNFNFSELLNILSENYGEGVVCGDRISSHEWVISQKRNGVVVCVVDSLEKIQLLRTKFDLPDYINESHTTESKITSVIEKHLFEKKTEKRLRKIRQQISEIIGCGWYDVKISSDLSIIKVIFNNEYMRFSI